MIYRDKKKQNYDPINFETLGDHSDWVLEDSPPFLTIEEVEALRNDLASMTIQPISNDIGMLLVILITIFLFDFITMSFAKLSKLLLL
jgi:hypothetical protein